MQYQNSAVPQTSSHQICSFSMFCNMYIDSNKMLNPEHRISLFQIDQFGNHETLLF